LTVDICPKGLHTFVALGLTQVQPPSPDSRGEKEVDVSHGIQSFKDGSRLVPHLALRIKQNNMRLNEMNNGEAKARTYIQKVNETGELRPQEGWQVFSRFVIWVSSLH
jgi:hypothetical protein